MVLVSLLAGCSDGSPSGQTAPSETSTVIDQPSSEAQPPDGVLKFGLLVPTSDPSATFGTSLVPVVQTMVNIINTFGGFNSRSLELVVKDEGTTPEAARTAVREFMDIDGVDAIIGPFSAIVAPAVIPAVVANGTGVCSPSVSSLNFTAFDDSGLLIRTGVQDTDIVNKMTELAVQSGSQLVSVAFPDDPYGRGLVRLLRQGLKERNVEVDSATAYDVETDDLSIAAKQINSDRAQVDLIITTPSTEAILLNQLVEISSDSVIIVNDVVIDATLTYSPEVPEESRPRIFGLSPNVNNGGKELLNLLQLTDPSFSEELSGPPSYAVYTVDCLLLMWLSALVAESDDARKFSTEYIEVANDGSPCLWISDCKLVIGDDFNIDYKGIADLILDDYGDAVNRNVLIYQFDADGRPQVVEGTADVSLRN